MVWERQTSSGRRMETATLTYNFSWLYHLALSSRPHLAFRPCSTQPGARCVPLCGTVPQQSTQQLPGAPVTPNFFWLQAETESKLSSRGHLHILFHNTHTFPFNHVTAFRNVHMCVLCRVFLVDGSVKGQYVTNRRPCRNVFPLFR